VYVYVTEEASGLVNGLLGRKLCSTSRTPGHTKHFQTHFLDAGRHLLLVDSPGLVFPLLGVDRALQVLFGLFPIAHLRDPFTSLRRLAELVPVERLYGLPLQSPSPPYVADWSPLKLAEALALKRGFVTARSGRPDLHRAARFLLIEALDGRLPLLIPPPPASSTPVPAPVPASDIALAAAAAAPQLAADESLDQSATATEAETEAEAEARRRAERKEQKRKAREAQRQAERAEVRSEAERRERLRLLEAERRACAHLQRFQPPQPRPAPSAAEPAGPDLPPPATAARARDKKAAQRAAEYAERLERRARSSRHQDPI
jgi:hypothetical protein